MSLLLRAALLLVALLWGACATAAHYTFEGVARVVAVGDLHGDYAAYMKVLAAAGLVDADGRWAGGRAHLVQLGDIADRGPESTRIVDHLRALSRQALRVGGRVHALVGNHEAMLVQGDYRYVHPDQYRAFVSRRSVALRERYYQAWIDALRGRLPPERRPVFDDAYRADWERAHPLGFVEHARAWSPAGDYGRWVRGNPAVVRINGTLFMHAGLSSAWLAPDIDTINAQLARELASPVAAGGMMSTDENSPLWYRGLADAEDPGEAEHVQRLLARHGATRLVVGHTTTPGAILPRFGNRVLMIDTGISSAQGGHPSFLLFDSGRVRAWLDGEFHTLPADPAAVPDAYLAAVADRLPHNAAPPAAGAPEMAASSAR